MKKRNTLVKIKVLDDWKGVPKGTIVRARTISFGCMILDAPYIGVDLGKSKYKVLEVLKDDER